MLKALADECTKGLFFSVGKHATYHPEILRQVLARGPHGRHPHLVARQSQQQEDDGAAGQGRDREGLQRSEVRARHQSGAVLPLPAASAQSGNGELSRHPQRRRCGRPTSTPSISGRAPRPEKIVETVMNRLDKLGKGIILMHDFQKHTGEALPTLLARLKAGGYKIVQIKAKTTFQSVPEYDEALLKELKVPTQSARPVSSVVQTVSQ